MHVKTNHHTHMFLLHWNPSNTALMLLLFLLILIFLLLFLSVTQSAYAQSSVPATATQAARMPEFVAKLAYRPNPSDEGTHGNQYGNSAPECVQNKGPLKVIHNFTDEWPDAGLAFDRAGRIYGASGSQGGFGKAFSLALHGGGWIFTSLYSFLGGSYGENPAPGVIGPEGAMYGIADGGLQTCQPHGCGVVYRLRPSPVVCRSAMCSWGEEVIYRFTGTPDGASPNGHLVFDRAGNLYGTTDSGGADGYGTVFELIPANGGWTEKVIHSFSRDEGGYPYSLLLGEDGDLYGTAYNNGGGMIFQLTPSGDTWTEQILVTFSGCSDTGGSCYPVLYDSHGLLGTYMYARTSSCYPNECWYSRIFQLSRGYLEILDDTYGSLGGNQGMDVFTAVVSTPGGIYATETHFVENDTSWARIIKAPHQAQSGDCWADPQTVVCFMANSGYPFMNRDLEVDASGNIYGTTNTQDGCDGTVWQVTPP